MGDAHPDVNSSKCQCVRAIEVHRGEGPEDSDTWEIRQGDRKWKVEVTQEHWPD